MKKIWLTLLAAVMIFSVALGANQGQAAAAASQISIYIDGQKLYSSQAPIMVKGRAMLPMRAIFEALDATVDWNAKTKTVTAKRDQTTIVLKIGSTSAVVNNRTLTLDVPGQIYKGSTMVPVRFVSEALGEKVDWNASNKTVTITTSGGPVNAVAYVSARIISKNGDGRDVEVSFPKVSPESGVSEYRVLMVKSGNAYNFNLAQALSTGSYTSIRPNGDDVSITLSSQTRDVNGDLLRSGQSYAAFVLTVGKKGNSALSGVSQTISLSSVPSVGAVSNIKVSDASDYGDGRDLSVSFTKAQTESNITNYRIYVVKTKDKNSFDLAAANKVPSSNFTVVNKAGTTLSGNLSSSARDTSGELIRNGVPYTVFVMSVSNTGSYTSQLSAASSSITLAANAVSAPVITRVDDISNYGDGRDLRVNFNKVSDESRIGSYRIFVVKDSKAGSFSLSAANNVPSAYYTQVGKTGYNLSQVLSSGARDVDGSLIANGVVYRVFVMAVGTGSYSGSNALSSASSSIVLYGNGNVDAASNVNVSDISDYGDGRDLLVNFKRAGDERYIGQYRILVVKNGDAGRFDLNDANAVRSSNYTAITPNGGNVSKALASGARDVDGDAIRNGISYRVFVLSVGTGSYAGTNALSSYSPSITLSGNVKVDPATNVKAADIGDNGDARDLQVTFNRAKDESNIKGYRILVVEADSARFFGLSDAEKVSSSAYTAVDKTGSDLRGVLKAGARDVDNGVIKNDVSYKVFVLSVGAYGTNALSDPSAPITLTTKTASPATNVNVSDVGDRNNGSDLEVSFTKAADERNLYEYRILVVPTDKANVLKVDGASDVKIYTIASKGSNYKQTLSSDAKDIDGNFIENGVAYKVFILSVMSPDGRGNVLSTPSDEIKLQSNPTLVTRVTASELKDEEVKVTFAKAADESTIDYYKVFAVPVGSTTFMTAKSTKEVPDSFKKVDKANKGSYETAFQAGDKDIYGQELNKHASYLVYVLSVLKGDQASKSVLSSETGFMFVTAFNNEEDAKKYVKNQLVSDQGSIYQVLKDSPQGTPGTSEDYKLLKKAEAKTAVSSKTKG
ncbi:hypothetical protein FHS19_004679 [Paenibacillus rhizosphaerae]|uniref:Copper amine oxidase-like N-terminal domain-containing protein n=1 Tax=Paenibacillus rhizosphaerae TaxID=297318 RepID=A0A839TSC3_9BACL|nr:copper amine oxidase N-terminal domain-containing protein [Paenibacillus rhizosphaerae]MBB3129974.1 hypothetical protein [Paenibacillus rhizosphaerae]